MRILAIDLGESKSVACTYDESAQATYVTVPTTPAAMHDLFVAQAPDRIVIEVCGIAGWMHDLAHALELDMEVVDTRHEAWRWNKVKRKTDRADALKLARLSAMHQVSTVHIPARSVRQWKSAVTYRYTLVDRRTAIKNTIGSLVDVQGCACRRERGRGRRPDVSSWRPGRSLSRRARRMSCGAASWISSCARSTRSTRCSPRWKRDWINSRRPTPTWRA